jgi:hypothetical protein
MNYRNLLTLAAMVGAFSAVTALCDSALAETIAVDNGIAIKQTDIATPTRGMTMDQVASKFGAPTQKIPAVGRPPISRWEYPGFVVYFESDYVIHSVVVDS